MTIAHANEPALRKPLRLWPGVVAAVLLLVVRLVVPAVVPGSAAVGMIGAVIGGLVILIWWLFFSRAPWAERVAAILLMIVALFLTSRVVHASIANGMMGMMLPFSAIPALAVALVTWAAATRRLAAGPRRAWMVAAILLACGVFTLLRTGGISGDADSDLHWRWTKTPEELLLARTRDEALAPPRDLPPDVPQSGPSTAPGVTTPVPERPVPPGPASEPRPGTAVSAVASAPEPPIAAATTEAAPAESAAAESASATSSVGRAEWPGFRGAYRDSVVRSVQIATNWSQSPPTELWRRPIGPGWSSFAVRGQYLYTQEQRGDEEDVSCYDLTTGKPVWRHRDAARFWESNAGPGPRGTPTLSGNRVYTFGATGIVNALNARTGARVWSRNAQADAGAKLPGWGFASSPLVVNDLVIVAASGRLAAYEIAGGTPRWFGPARGASYSSPQLMTIGGVEQVVLLSSTGATAVSPTDGKQLWTHDWEGVPILQPGRTADGDVLLTTGDMSGGAGMRRVAVSRGAGGWTAQERWTSRGLKPYFNDFVVHKGHAFGFDGSILACIDLEDGSRKWKGGRYGHGQLVLLPDQDLLLVLSEEGELALVRATPDQFTEIARVPAIEGKTWNHPVLAGDVLLVRNGEEMAAFRLAPAVP